MGQLRTWEPATSLSWAHLESEEGARNVDVLASDNNNLLTAESLLGDDCCQSPKQVACEANPSYQLAARRISLLSKHKHTLAINNHWCRLDGGHL